MRSSSIIIPISQHNCLYQPMSTPTLIPGHFTLFVLNETPTCTDHAPNWRGGECVCSGSLGRPFSTKWPLLACPLACPNCQCFPLTVHAAQIRSLFLAFLLLVLTRVTGFSFSSIDYLHPLLSSYKGMLNPSQGWQLVQVVLCVFFSFSFFFFLMVYSIHRPDLCSFPF